MVLELSSYQSKEGVLVFAGLAQQGSLGPQYPHPGGRLRTLASDKNLVAIRQHPLPFIIAIIALV